MRERCFMLVNVPALRVWEAALLFTSGWLCACKNVQSCQETPHLSRSSTNGEGFF